MEDKNQRDQSRLSRNPNWITRSVNKFHRYRHNRRADKDHKSAAERAARSTAWATWAIAALTIATIVVGWSQYRILSGQLDQMAATERPWVMLNDIQPESLSSDDEAGVSFWVKLSVRNVGHSPAQNVSVTGELLMSDPTRRPDQAMATVCQKAKGSFVTPGLVLFPDQTQNVDGDTPKSFEILAQKIWAARDARIKSVDRAHYVNPARAEAWATALRKFPFYAPLDLVGCINYRSSDDSTPYQTGFIFSVGLKQDGADFPLLSGESIPDISPDLSDPDVAALHARRLQRMVPGNKIKLGIPSYGSFVN